MAEVKVETNWVESPLKTSRKKAGAKFIRADYDRAVFTSVEGLPATVDALYSQVMALSANVWAIQRRNKIVEILLEKNGAVTRDMIEKYQPTKEEQAKWAAERDAFVAELNDPYKVMGDVDYISSIDVPHSHVKKAL